MSQNTSTAAHGCRKSAVANAYIASGQGQIVIRCTYKKRDLLNLKRAGKSIEQVKTEFSVNEYFSTLGAYKPFEYLLLPLVKINKADKFDIVVRVKGGGIKAQLDAARLAIVKALIKIDQSYKSVLDDYCTSDGRKKERRKIGCRGKARRKVQFSKR